MSLSELGSKGREEKGRSKFLCLECNSYEETTRMAGVDCGDCHRAQTSLTQLENSRRSERDGGSDPLSGPVMFDPPR